VELIQFVVLLSQIRPDPGIQIQKVYKALKLKSKTQKNSMESIYFFLSPLPNQSQKFKYKNVQASFEAEIQDSKNSMETCKRKKVEIAITCIHRPS
jgi:hypothetical protein